MKNILEKLISYRTTEDNPEEIKRGFEYISSLFDAEKFEVQNFEKNGSYSQLVSFRGKDALRPQFLLNGHFDVVPAEDEDQYRLRISGGKAFGRGTADMKGMLTVLIEVMRELGAKENPPDVALLVTADEEVGGEDGVGFAVRELGIRPEFVLCADATDAKVGIVTKEKGGIWVELTAQGKVAHGAYPWMGENAIDKVMGGVERIRQFIGPVEPDAWKTTVNFALAETSNKTPNKVPGDARAVLDIRFTEEVAQTPEDLFVKIEELVPEVTARILKTTSLLFVDEENPYLQEFKKISERAFQREVPLCIEHGATDARFFGEVGVPAIIFGAIGEGHHAEGEWVDLKSLDASREILLEFLRDRKNV